MSLSQNGEYKPLISKKKITSEFNLFHYNGVKLIANLHVTFGFRRLSLPYPAYAFSYKNSVTIGKVSSINYK